MRLYRKLDKPCIPDYIAVLEGKEQQQCLDVVGVLRAALRTFLLSSTPYKDLGLGDNVDAMVRDVKHYALGAPVFDVCCVKGICVLCVCVCVCLKCCTYICTFVDVYLFVYSC